MAFLTTDDLEPFATIDPAKGQEMIEDATALAVLAAPCLANEDDDLTAQQLAAVKAILRSAILRWNDSGSGALTQQTAGPFSQTVDNRQNRRGMFLQSEVEQLQAVCRDATDSSGAFSIDTAPGCGTITHADVCSINFGATYCSCGAILTGFFPLYERGCC